MRLTMMVCLMAAAGAASGAGAAPSVRIRGAVARVVVIPEARSDIAVTIVKTNPRLPLRIRQFAGNVFVDGDIAHRAHVCHSLLGRPSVGVWGRGDIRYQDMPQVVIHTPMDVRVSAGDAVFGSIGRSNSLDFSNRGCGDWTIGNVKGNMRLAVAGSGDARSGSAASADLSVAGSGDLATQEVRQGLTAVSTGSGDITAGSVYGPLNIRIAGSGDVKARSGQVTDMTAQIAGSGDVRFGGVAQNLNASIAGSGDITVAKVTGQVNKRVFGS
ncbi:MAG: GIN domain-containing protein, partial [Caulobacteraceae bacterium]